MRFLWIGLIAFVVGCSDRGTPTPTQTVLTAHGPDIYTTIVSIDERMFYVFTTHDGGICVVPKTLNAEQPVFQGSKPKHREDSASTIPPPPPPTQ